MVYGLHEITGDLNFFIFYGKGKIVTSQKTTTLQQKFGFQDTDLRTPAHDALMVWLDGNAENILLNRYQPLQFAQEDIRSVVEEMQGEVRALIDENERIKEKSASDSSFFGKQRHHSAVAMLEKCHAWVPPEQRIVECFVGIGIQQHRTEVDPFLHRVYVSKKVWEYPIMTGKEFMVGFVDMLVRVEIFDKLAYYCDGLGLPCQWGCSGRQEEYLFEIKPSISSVGELIRQIRMYQQYKSGSYIVVSPDDRFASVLSGQGIGFIKAPSL